MQDNIKLKWWNKNWMTWDLFSAKDKLYVSQTTYRFSKEKRMFYGVFICTVPYSTKLIYKYATLQVFISEKTKRC